MHDPDWVYVGKDGKGNDEYICRTCRRRITVNSDKGQMPSLGKHS